MGLKFIKGSGIGLTKHRRVLAGKKNYNNLVDELIRERTKELEDANEQLRQEIEKRKKAEEVLEVSFKQITSPIAILDRDFNFIRVNEAYARADERDVSDFPGHNHFEFYPSDAKPIFEEVVEKKLSYKVFARPFTYYYNPERGTTYWDFNLEPILDSMGEVYLLVLALNDVTNYIKLKEELQKSNRHINNILESITDVFIALDSHWRFTYLNKEAELYLKGSAGASKESLLGKNIWEMLPNLVGTKFYNECHRAGLEQGSVLFELGFVFKDRMFEVNAYPSKDGLSVYLRDITERKRMEEALRLSEELFSKAFHLNPASMAIVSLKGSKFINVNESFLKRNGFSKGEVIGRSLKELNFGVDFNECAVVINEIIEKGFAYNKEVRFRTKSGQLVEALFSGTVINLYGDPCILSIVHDISKHKQLYREMLRLDRLKLMGEVAAGIGHEIRNPMTTIKGFLQLLCGKEECARYQGYFNLMIEELNRANSIITEFLALARNKEAALTKQSLNKVLEAIFPLIQADAMKNYICISLELGEIPELLLDEKEIRQVTLNLVRNGLDAMCPGGCLTIRTFIEDETVVMAVQDQGKGIEPAALEKLGTPFFTTKDNGTGLGLAVCYSIANRHEAEIDVATGPGGTTFFVRFKTSGS